MTFTIDALASEVAEANHCASQRQKWAVARPRTDDSATILWRLASKLKERRGSLCPIVLSPPRGMFDTGSVALMQASVGLMDHALANGSLSSELKSATPWGRKLSAVRTALEEKADQIVLLINEPHTWTSLRSDPEEPEFGQHAEEAARLVDEIGCCKVVVEQRFKTMAAQLDTRCGNHAEKLLSDSSNWGALAGFTSAVLQRYGAGLKELSELEIRLLVALAATYEPMPASLDDPFSYIKRLGAFIQRKATTGAMRQVLSKLSVVRGAFATSMLEYLHVDKLGQPWGDMLQLCILQKTTEGWILPSIFRSQATMNSALQSDRQQHAEIARYYVDQIELKHSLRKEFQNYLPDMEAFHHAARAADPALAFGRRVFFSEQYDALGKSLSQAHRYDDAIEAFKKSLQWDHEDDYAHHYLAFNLDVQGKDRKTVESHYTSAIGISPFKAWWWSRWICFLITLGRTNEAEREWAEAIAALGLNGHDTTGQTTLYFHLHSWVLRLLLHRGQLDFAAKVLEDIPEMVWDEDAHDTGILNRLQTHLHSLFEARRNRTVLPVFIDPTNWWMTRPNLSICEELFDGKAVTKWLPGRIESIENGTLSIALGLPPQDGQTEADVQTWVVTRADFDRLSGTSKYALHAGRFIELVYYGGEVEPKLFLRPEEEHGLPPVRPDPARYLRNQQGGV